jgi:large subunit ribosomal protein L18
MKKSKASSRLRRAARSRATMRRLKGPRLSVHRTPRHIYAQLIIPGITDKVVASASTLEKEFGDAANHNGNVDAAQKVGTLIAQRALAAGVTKVAFDRAGYKYHGRIKALADAAREQGLDF